MHYCNKTPIHSFLKQKRNHSKSYALHFRLKNTSSVAQVPFTRALNLTI